MAENNVSELIRNSLEGIRTVADSGTVLGEPINTNNGTIIIPVSKITVGFASGGVDYMPKSSDKDATQKAVRPATPCFGGGGGTGISVAPVCFLVINADGKVTVLDVNAPSPVPAIVGTIDSLASFAQKAPEIISKLKAIFSKGEPDGSLDDEELKLELEALKDEVTAEVEGRIAKEEAKKNSKKSK